MKRGKGKMFALTTIALASSLLMSGTVFAETADKEPAKVIEEPAKVKEEVAVESFAIVVNGVTLERQYKNIKGFQTVPLVAVLDALELKHTYEFVARTFVVTTENKTVRIGYEFPNVVTEPALATKFFIKVEPIVLDQVTYISTDLFSEILGIPVELEEGTLYIGKREEVIVPEERIILTEADAGKDIVTEIVKGSTFEILISKVAAEGFWAVLVEEHEGAITLVEEVEAVTEKEVKKEETKKEETKKEEVKKEEVKKEETKEETTTKEVIKEITPAISRFVLKANKEGEYALVVAHPAVKTEVGKEKVNNSYTFNLKVIVEKDEVTEEKEELPVIATKGIVLTKKDNNTELHINPGQEFTIALDQAIYADQKLKVNVKLGYADVAVGQDAAGRLVFVISPGTYPRVEISIVDEAGKEIFAITGVHADI